MIIQNRLKSLFSSVILFTLSSCGLTEGLVVQREWSQSMRQLGIAPVFPPREDVYVGDVYAYAYDPESAETRSLFSLPWGEGEASQQEGRLALGMSPRLGRLNLISELSAEYARTISAAPSSSDLNGILGNSSLAAANELLERASEELNALRKEMLELEEQMATAEQNLTTATRNKATADRELTHAQEDLTRAKARSVDVSAEEAAVATATANLRASEDALTAAEEDLADADANNNDVEQEAVTNATRRRNAAQTTLTRATADLAQKKTQSVDVSAEEELVEIRRSAVRAAEVELSRLTAIRDDANSAVEKKTAENEPKITAAESKLEQAKTIRNAIAEVGSKSLYEQPQYANNNVFDGIALSDDSNPLNASLASRVNRLRIVGFPEFATTSITQGDLSALVPVEALATGLNITASNVEKVVVKIPSAESYSLSLAKVLPKVVDDGVIQKGGYVWPLKSEFAGDFMQPALLQTGYGSFSQYSSPPLGKTDTPTEDRLFFRIVTEVYYARVVDVSLFASRSFGANLAVGDSLDSGVSDDPDIDASVEEISIPGAITTPLVGDSASSALIRQIQDGLDRGNFLPGGAIQVVSYNSASIGLRMVYDRPIAVGIRGITLEVDPCFDKGPCRKAVVVGSRVIASDAPTR